MSRVASFRDLTITAYSALDTKTMEPIAVGLSMAVRCGPCIGFHALSLVMLGATRRELDETPGVAVHLGGGPLLMCAASAIVAVDGFAGAAAA